MSLFSVAILFVLIFTFGTARSNRNAYKKELYPVHIQLTNDWSTTEWSFLAPKNIARFIKNVMDCSVHGNAIKRLDESILTITMRSTPQGVAVGDEMYSSAEINPLRYLLRRWNIRPKTEIGPGAFKHDIVNLPPETLANDMKKLLALKKRQEKQAVDLNEGNENQ